MWHSASSLFVGTAAMSSFGKIRLETETQASLEAAGIVRLRRNDVSEARGRSTGVGADAGAVGRAGSGELNAIERIEELDPKRQACSFDKMDLFLGEHVEIVSARDANARNVAGSISEGIGRRLGECRRIEVLAGCSGGNTNLDMAAAGNAGRNSSNCIGKHRQPTTEGGRVV